MRHTRLCDRSKAETAPITPTVLFYSCSSQPFDTKRDFISLCRKYFPKRGKSTCVYLEKTIPTKPRGKSSRLCHGARRLGGRQTSGCLYSRSYRASATRDGVIISVFAERQLANLPGTCNTFRLAGGTINDREEKVGKGVKGERETLIGGERGSA